MLLNFAGLLRFAFARTIGAVGGRRLWSVALATTLGFLSVGCDGPEAAPAPRPVARHHAPLARAETQVELNASPAKNSKLPVYALKMATGDLVSMDRNPYLNNLRPATFLSDGESYEGVGVRVRGAFSRSWPKKSLKIEFTKEKPFQGHHSINLNSGWRDPALVREAVAYHVYEMCGAVASQSRMVRLDLNGKFRGLFVEVEQPGKGFLERVKLKGAVVYKASSRSNRADERDLGEEAVYRQHYSKETHEQEDYGDLQQLCRELRSAPDTLEFFNRNIDVEKYINFLAATVLVQNWDGFNKNHFLVRDCKGTGKWLVVPWDLDRTFGDHWNMSFSEARLPILLGTRSAPDVTGWNRLEDRFFSERSLRAKFLDRLRVLLEKEFTREKLFPVLDRMESEMTAEATWDRQRWPGENNDFHRGINQIKRFIEQRREYLRDQLSRLR